LRAPTNILSLTTRMILQVQPVTRACLRQWTKRAHHIPDPELRRQALASLATKTFHCEGGSLCGLLAGRHYREAIQFIVAYQTISDYLDNLCDRSTSQDPEDFRALHEAMLHALTPDDRLTAYYRFRREQDDGGYLSALVQTCRDVLGRLPDYHSGAPALRQLAGLYADLQVHKHVRQGEREPRLQKWFAAHKDSLPSGLPPTKIACPKWPGMNLPPAPVPRWEFSASSHSCLTRQTPHNLPNKSGKLIFPGFRDCIFFWII